MCQVSLPDEPDTLLSVAVRFLAPVQPWTQGQDAIVIGSGKYRRQQVVTDIRDDDQWMCLLQSGGKDAIGSTHLCLVCRLTALVP